ncbi:MAG: hypothetical protein DMG16_25700 [Acidobacteria bacterium]|nr:MAG: hypothetical protein DMG16_25700 [Acidobacteriota bacterium]
MPKPRPEQELETIENIVRQHGGGVGAPDIAKALPTEIPERTLQYRLKILVDTGRLIREGEGRWAKYRAPEREEAAAAVETGLTVVPLSKGANEIREYLHKPAAARNPVGYNRDFLDSYRPNVTSYLSADERTRLAEIGKPSFKGEPAGTYAKQMLSKGSHHHVLISPTGFSRSRERKRERSKKLLKRHNDGRRCNARAVVRLHLKGRGPACVTFTFARPATLV